MEINPLRFNLVTGSPYKIDRPLKTLFYFEAVIDEETMKASLTNHISDWDIIFILNYKGKKNLMLIAQSNFWIYDNRMLRTNCSVRLTTPR